MKICLINNLYPPYARGGAEQVVKRTLAGLVNDGHQVVLITSTPEKPCISVEDGIKIYRLKPKNVFFYTKADKHCIFARFFWHIFDTFHLSIALQVGKVLKIERPCLVHTHNLMGLSFLIPWIIRKQGLRHLHTVHDVQLVEPSGIILKTKEKTWRYNGYPTRIYSAIMRSLMGSPEVVISPSQFLLDFYTARSFFAGSKFVVLRNPMTFPFTFSTSKQKEKTTIKFLYLGQMEKHKGVLFLVESFCRLFREQPDLQAELHIVGSGTVEEEVRGLASSEKRINVYGHRQRVELPDLFEQMDLTIVPSLCYENSPTVIFESLSFGIPVLASDIEGIAELIKEGENGLTFVAGDFDSLKQKIIWCVGHRDQVEEMSKKTSHALVAWDQGGYISKLVSLYYGDGRL